MSPATNGTGSVPGQDQAIVVPPRENDTSGLELPPPENDISEVAATGDQVPSGCCMRVVSTGTHVEPERTRTGSEATFRVKDPSGFANRCSVSDVSAVTSTATPEDRACSAAASAPRTAGAPGVAAADVASALTTAPGRQAPSVKAAITEQNRRARPERL